MSDAIDAGPIVYQAMFDIAPEDTGLSVAMRCVRLGIPLIAKVVEAAGGRAAIPRIEQRLDERTYFPPGPPLDGRVEWCSARRIVDFVRAARSRLPGAIPGHPWGHRKWRLRRPPQQGSRRTAGDRAQLAIFGGGARCCS